MKWNDYIYQPTGHVLSRRPITNAASWLRRIHGLGLMRVFADREPMQVRDGESPEAALGVHFRPDTVVNLELLQVAGLLLKNSRLDRDACAWSARRNGGGLYFRWFLAQVDESEPDPLPTVEFPLHRSRWRKRKGGRRGHDAQQ